MRDAAEFHRKLVEAHRLVGSISFCGAFWSMAVEFGRTPGEDSVELDLSWKVNDRNDPDQLVTIHFREYMACDLFVHMGKGDVLAWVRRSFKKFVDHETDEALLLAGARVFDPHVPALKRPKITFETIAPDELSFLSFRGPQGGRRTLNSPTQVRILVPDQLETKEVHPCPNPAVPVRTDDEPPGSTAPGGSCPDGAVRS